MSDPKRNDPAKRAKTTVQAGDVGHGNKVGSRSAHMVAHPKPKAKKTLAPRSEKPRKKGNALAKANVAKVSGHNFLGLRGIWKGRMTTDEVMEMTRIE